MWGFIMEGGNPPKTLVFEPQKSFICNSKSLVVRFFKYFYNYAKLLLKATPPRLGPRPHPPTPLIKSLQKTRYHK